MLCFITFCSLVVVVAQLPVAYFATGKSLEVLVVVVVVFVSQVLVLVNRL